MLYAIAIFAPLFGSVVAGLFGKAIGDRAAQAVTITCMVVASLCGVGAFVQLVYHGTPTGVVSLGTWVEAGSFHASWALRYDTLAAVMVAMVTTVATLIHIYSVGYMEHDENHTIWRFFSYLSLFSFAMLMLVSADNLLQLFFGWEGVGLASYLLIGYWYYRPSAGAAAMKAFIVNRVGDLGFALGIALVFVTFHSIEFNTIFGAVKDHMAATYHVLGGTWPAYEVICILLFIGAMGKSAQIGLHVWLPDAMEGPTPVSALIHAATMVTAGVYLVARCAPLWSQNADAQLLVGVIGGITALTGAILGCVQWDIKRILAYSTMSQIGYMIMGVGVGAYEGGVAHFFTHAFFKAQLFLGSGIIIHALANEQDVRRMGGLRTKMPFAFIAMLVGVLAICGIPGLSGSFSKDAVIYGTLQHGHPILYAIGILTAGITAYYMFRLLFVTFFGAYRGDVDPSDLGIRHPELAGTPAAATAHDDHAHHAPSWLMNVPVAILIVPSVLAGWVMYGGEHSPWARFFAQQFPTVTLPTPPVSELATTFIVLAFVAAGIAVAWSRYASRLALENAVERLRNESVRMPAILSNAFYFDAALDLVFVRASQLLGTLFGRLIDPQIIDGAVRETAFSAQWLGTLVRSLQTGLVRAYAFVLVFGVACFLVYYAVVAGGLH